MSLSLPQCPDKAYPVGSTTFATPVQPSVTFGTATLGDQPALVLDEVAFTAYYPANVTASPSKGVDWLLRPLNESLKGIVKFAESTPSWILRPVVYCYGALLKIPVYSNAPLLKPKGKPWPLVIYSHGLGGSRTAYSQICSRLAASGRVVLAIEHRDGTSTCCVSREWSEDGSRRSRVIHYMAEKDLKRPEISEESHLPLRKDQLEFRRHEVYTVYHTFVSMLHRRHPQMETLDGSDIDWSSWTASDEQPLVEHSRDVALAGHSFGGCTMFYITSMPPPLWVAPIPVTKTLIHDPWLDPIPSPGPTPLDDYKIVSDVTPSASSEETLATEEQAKSLPDLLVMNSEGFTLWDEHFERLRSVVKAWGPKAKLLTLVKSQHPHFSDFFVLPLLPGRKTALKFMDSISRLSDAFLDGRLDERLALEPTRTMEVEVVGKKKDAYGQPKRTLKGAVGDIIVHS